MQRFYIPTTRQLKRIESTTRSPIYVHFSETITGSSTIRAFQQQQRFTEHSDQLVDHNLVFYFATIASNRCCLPSRINDNNEYRYGRLESVLKPKFWTILSLRTLRLGLNQILLALAFVDLTVPAIWRVDNVFIVSKFVF